MILYRLCHADGYRAYAMIDPRCEKRRGWEQERSALLRLGDIESLVVEAYESGDDGTCGCGPLDTSAALPLESEPLLEAEL